MVSKLPFQNRVNHFENSEFERVARLYMDVVYRAALCYSKNKSDAEDAVQNAFLKLLKSEKTFESDEHVRKWLIRVSVNECKNTWKNFWNRNVISFDDLEKEPETVASEGNEIFDEVMKLPKNYSVVVHLYYYEGYDCKEIADILKISESNVQTRLMRARKILKERLEEAWK